MPSNNANQLQPLADKLERLAKLAPGDRAAILALPFTAERIRDGRYLVREGQRPLACCLLLDGFACRNKLNADGGRQILSFHIKGDILDLQHIFLILADHIVQTITPSTVAWIPKADLKRLAIERPAIAEALWRDALIDASIFREWVLNVGRRGAKARVAHMLCEFATRCVAAGLGSTATIEFPMTQEEIADATGLTSVHVNRMIRMLRDENAMVGAGRDARISDWLRMTRIADFDPAYLHAAASQAA